MKKRVGSTLAFFVLLSVMLAEHSVMAEQSRLLRPAGLTWNWEVSDQGKVIKAEAKWEAVTDAKGYRLTLLKDDVPVMGEQQSERDVMVSPEVLSYEFTSSIKEGGIYSFRVSAIGDGVINRNSKVEDSTEHAYTPPSTVTEVVMLTPIEQIQQGERRDFDALVKGLDLPSQKLEWSMEGAVSETSFIQETSGVCSIAKEETASKIRIRAVSVQDNTKSVVMEIAVVTPTPTASAVTIIPSKAVVKKGSKLSFQGLVTGEFQPSQSVIWSIQQAASEQTTISETGELSVAPDETEKLLTIKAVSLERGNPSRTAAVTVSDLPQTAEPFSLSWSQGIASWQASKDAKTYMVELYQDGVKLGGHVTTKETAYDFTKKMTKTGFYTFRVSAVGDGIHATNSNQVESSVYSFQAQAKITSITILPQAPIQVTFGSSLTFRTVTEGTDNPPAAVEWDVTGQQSSATTINRKGKLTVGQDETATTITVEAVSTYDRSQSEIVKVNVIPKPDPVQELKGLIGELPEMSKVTSGDAQHIGDVKEKYDLLNEKEKKQLYDPELEQLSRAIEQLPHIEFEVTKEMKPGYTCKAEGLGLVLTPEEIKGQQKVILNLHIEPTDQMPGKQELLALAKKEKLFIGECYVMILQKQVADDGMQPITDSPRLKLTVTMPSQMRGRASYEILGLQNNQAEVLESQASHSEIEFYTNPCSGYAIAYEQTVSN